MQENLVRNKESKSSMDLPHESRRDAAATTMNNTSKWIPPHRQGESMKHCHQDSGGYSQRRHSCSIIPTRRHNNRGCSQSRSRSRLLPHDISLPARPQAVQPPSVQWTTVKDLQVRMHDPNTKNWHEAAVALNHTGNMLAE